MMSALPPVFVMNLYYTGIGIARNMAGMGVGVYGLSSETDAPGVRSRFFQGVYRVPNGRDEPAALYQRLLELKNFHKERPLIFPTRDFDVLFLHDYRQQLEPYYRLPQLSAVTTLLDKWAMAEVAQDCGITSPATALCNSTDAVEQAIERLRFPLVVKPRFACQWRRSGAWETVGARKAFLVTSAEQLHREYRRLALVNPEVLLQQYVCGSDTDVVVCGCYIGETGTMLGYFTAKKLRQNPPLFGTGCVIEAVDIPDIVPTAGKLLRACRYTGLAEVEFKHDQSVDRFFLIEVNPRHWDQHELGRGLGVNLTRLAYQQSVGMSVTPQRPVYRQSKLHRWVAEKETCLLILHQVYEQLFHRDASKKAAGGRFFSALKKLFAEIIFLLRGQKIFGILNRRDPLPCILLCLRFGREFARNVTAFLIGRGNRLESEEPMSKVRSSLPEDSLQ